METKEFKNYWWKSYVEEIEIPRQKHNNTVMNRIIDNAKKVLIK